MLINYCDICGKEISHDANGECEYDEAFTNSYDKKSPEGFFSFTYWMPIVSKYNSDQLIRRKAISIVTCKDCDYDMQKAIREAIAIKRQNCKDFNSCVVRDFNAMGKVDPNGLIPINKRSVGYGPHDPY